MKTSLLLLLVALTPWAAFAQGKVIFSNDQHHPITIGGALAPQVGTTYDVMSGLTAQLWGGTSPGSLTLQSQLSPAGAVGLDDGLLKPTSVTLSGIPALSSAFFQIFIFETSAGDYANAANGIRFWHAATPVFQASVGAIAPIPLVNSPNWTPGPITLSMGFGLPPPPPTLLDPGQIGNHFRFSFVAQAYRAYTVEYRDSATATNWSTLTNIPFHPAARTIQISDTITEKERFFRVRTP